VKRTRYWQIAALLGGIFVGVILLGYVFNLKAVGVADKGFWDWLELVIVPAALVLIAYWFSRSENRRTQEIANQQRTLERKIADDRRQDDMLQAYLDGMSQLLTDKARPLRRARPGDNLSVVARARTLTVLPRLDGDRKRSVLQFLYESDLITKGRATLDLTGANLERAVLWEFNLSEADLSAAYLFRADLFRAGLRGAVLSEAFLRKAALRESDLTEADLREALLGEADFSRADLSKADLRDADLDDAILREAILHETILRHAELRRTDLTCADLFRADLSEASLAQADLREAHLEEAILGHTFLNDADLRVADLSNADLRRLS
jgi:uncharacterized protein YjbI with pentapeptide repeats